MIQLLQPQQELSASTLVTAPFISIIVPVRNEAQCIESTLEKVFSQTYDPQRFEVIVADGESTDETRAIVRRLQERYPNLILVPNPGRWSSAGRNAAIQASQGEIILLVDGHCDVRNPNYLRDLVDAFERSGADCIGRPQPLDVSGASSFQRAVAVARGCQLGHHPDSFIYADQEAIVKAHSVAIAYKREVFEQVGIFDERFDACEDVELNHRVDQAGLTCFFTPKAAVYYHPRASLRGLFRQMMRYGRGRSRLLRKHPETFTLPGFVPGAFVAGLGCGALLSVVSTWCCGLYLGVLAFYLSLITVWAVSLALRHRRVSFLTWIPLVLITVHVGAGTGQILEWIRPQAPPRAATLRQDPKLNDPKKSKAA